MVQFADGVKRCRLCQRQLPLQEFYRTKAVCWSSRCKSCHGVGQRQCHVCQQTFVGKHGRKACSERCHNEMLRPPTFLICQQCGRPFGPVDKLKRKCCSVACKHLAARTGRRTIRKTVTKARSAQSLLRYHIQAGHITRPTTCEGCGANDRPIEGAHFNYDEPLRVRWLCRSCHVRWDKREPKHATYIVSVPDGKQEAML